VTLYSHPDAGELLDATIAFLTDVLGPAVPAEHAFHLRVAVNALGMVRRELATGADDEAAHRDRLAALGFADDAALATALRSGAVPPDLLPPVGRRCSRTPKPGYGWRTPGSWRATTPDGAGATRATGTDSRGRGTRGQPPGGGTGIERGPWYP
jgi:hypothetical protein